MKKKCFYFKIKSKRKLVVFVVIAKIYTKGLRFFFSYICMIETHAYNHIIIKREFIKKEYINNTL
jgi:hypothetical protein